MFRMLRAEFYKMYKSRGFKVLCIVAILLGLLNVVMNNVINEEFLSKSLGTQVSEEQMDAFINNDSDEIISPGSLGFHTNGAKDPFNITAVEAFHSSFGSGIMEILIAVLVGTMVAKEYPEGTIKNTLAYGKNRTSFYIAKFINIIAGSAIIMAIMTGVTTLGVIITKGWGEQFKFTQLIHMVETFLGAVIVFGAVAAIIMVISSLVKSNGATIGISVALFILLPTMASFLYGVYDWFDKIYELSLFYNSALVKAIKASLQDVIRSMVIGVVTMAIALVAGITIFRGQDIK